MDKHSAGVITFEEVASIINSNAYNKTEVTPREDIKKLVEDLSNYFEKLSNTDFDKSVVSAERLVLRVAAP